MKQLLQSLKSGETYIEEVPIPTAQPGTALVRTGASLVSTGTERMVVDFAQKSLAGKARARPDLVRQLVQKARQDGLVTALGSAFNRLDRPMPLGYSSAGVIDTLGEGMWGFRPGDRVVCAGGGHAVHAEYALVPQNLLAALPEHVPFEHGAFATLGAIALHGFRLGGAQIGGDVAVIGLGLLGQLAGMIARAAGCRVFGVDLDASRVDLGLSFGLEAVLPEGSREAGEAFTHGRGFDAVLICADSKTNEPVELAGDLARDRAVVVALGAVGLEIPRKTYFAKELQFVVSRAYGPGRYDPQYEQGGQDYPIGYVRWTEGRNLEAFVQLLAEGRLDVGPLISHRFPIVEAPRAYDLILGRNRESFLGVVLTYPEVDDRKADLPRAVTPASKPGISICNLGVIGAGNFANAVVLPGIRGLPSLRLVGIASAAGLSAQAAKEKFGFSFAASDPQAVIRHPEVNTVAVLTRHDSHAALAREALQAGKHVFLEKPPALNAGELAGLREQLEASPGSLLAVGYNRRFAPLARKLKDFVDSRSDPLHAVYRVNAGFLPTEHWLHDPRLGGGRLVGEACHFVDFLTFLVGLPPVRVSGQQLPDGGVYHGDNFQLAFTFPDGSLGTLVYLANGDRSVSKERLEVFAGGRAAVLDNFRSLTLASGGRSNTSRTRWQQDKGHRAIWTAFLDSIASGAPPPIPYEQIFAVSQATFAAQEALQTGLPQEISSFRE